MTTEDNGDVRNYIGITGSDFKERFRNHQKLFSDAIFSKDTELSKYIWNLRRTGQTFRTYRLILKRVEAYTAGASRRNLCNYRKRFILNTDKRTLFTKETFSNCRHVNDFWREIVDG